jgi:3-isopropylmalate dehydrogenase
MSVSFHAAMDKVTLIAGTAAPFLNRNVDTDTIIRIQRLMAFGRGSLGPYCLESLRFRPDGSEDESFVLNQPRYRGSSILIVGENFGCGSSREAAVWSLYDYGIRSIIGSSFGDIFYTNCLQNGLLPVTLPVEQVRALAQNVAQSASAILQVDLRSQKLMNAHGEIIEFSIDATQRRALLEGLDEIDMTLKLESSITAHQAQTESERPWNYAEGSKRPLKLLILAGDGVGPEVMAQVKRMVDWFQAKRQLPVALTEELYGISSWRAHGAVVRADAWAAIRSADAILFGATGSPEYDSIPREHWIPDNLLKIRQTLGLFANLRQVRMFDSLCEYSSLRPEVVRGADILIVRELAGGAYFGLPRGIEDLGGRERRAVNTIMYTSSEIRRIARVAFEQARIRSNRVCSVDKANVLEFGMLWRDVVQSVHDEEYPDVELSHMYVDNCAMQLVREPRQFDVLLTENLFGDILSDCAAMVAGSIGMLPSASLGELNTDGHRPALYEPIHGSAPALAGKHIANPLGAMMSFGECLHFSFGRPQDARLLHLAIGHALKQGIRTADIAGHLPSVSTDAMGDAVLDALHFLNPSQEAA